MRSLAAMVLKLPRKLVAPLGSGRFRGEWRLRSNFGRTNLDVRSRDLARISLQRRNGSKGRLLRLRLIGGVICRRRCGKRGGRSRLRFGGGKRMATPLALGQSGIAHETTLRTRHSAFRCLQAACQRPRGILAKAFGCSKSFRVEWPLVEPDETRSLLH